MIKNAIDIKKGNLLPPKGMQAFTQPIQFISEAEKDDDWFEHNADWLEWQGMKQVEKEGPGVLKKYNLAKGIIEKRDYIKSESAYEDVLDAMTTEGEDLDEAMELKFYPIIPTVINVLSTEFAKRNSKVSYKAVDQYSMNELIKAKTQEIEAVLIEDAQSKLLQELLAAGLDPSSPQAQEQMDPEALKKLPQIDEFYKKDFRTIGEIWATKQHAIDHERFKMDELEEIGFYDSLVADKAFFHFKMYEDDYGLELLKTPLTFFHKSPNEKYVSNGSYAGFFEVLTLSDILDTDGYKMTEDMLKDLEGRSFDALNNFLNPAAVNDGELWDGSKTIAQNRELSVDMKRLLANSQVDIDDCDPVNLALGKKKSGSPLPLQKDLFRVATMYWKGKRKLYWLTSINEGGEVTKTIVNEFYKPTNNPIYNNKFNSNKTEETLVYGDHLEPLWQNIVYGVKKISAVTDSPLNGLAGVGSKPIYLGVDQPKPGALRFQFKGENSIYGAKLPIEGCVFSEHNTESQGLVDLMAPGQVGFNMAMNQLMDIMIDEAGTVVVIDQNALPKHSYDGSWGKNNLLKAYDIIRSLSILPLDTTLNNTEGATNFSHYQKLDLAQSERLLSRISIAKFFKNETLEVIGFIPQRLGQQLGQIDTATGTEHAISGSFAQTENYFINFSDRLMPRVHQMRTDLAQCYHSKKSSFRLRSSLTDDERTWFELNGADIMLPDINVYTVTNANMRSVLEKMNNFMTGNNTTGASPIDIFKILQVDSIAKMDKALKDLDERNNRNAEADRAAKKEQWEAELKAKKEDKQADRDHKTMLENNSNRKDVLVAEIKASGYGAMQDINENQQSDLADQLSEIRKSEEYTQTMAHNDRVHNDKMALENRALDIKEQALDVAKNAAVVPLQVARENRTASEIKNGKGKK